MLKCFIGHLNRSSDPIGPLEVHLPYLLFQEIMTDQPTDQSTKHQQTDMKVHRELTLNKHDWYFSQCFEKADSAGIQYQRSKISYLILRSLVHKSNGPSLKQDTTYAGNICTAEFNNNRKLKNKILNINQTRLDSMSQSQYSAKKSFRKQRKREVLNLKHAQRQGLKIFHF